ncbi:MAG TPA: alpha-E domain-containing protein [Acidimicrobiales bacterium]|nr:alpha-E domain-containing protein [Acidimicrobiales bacterium]
MLARHAESLFWAGRYIERADATARLLDVTYHGILEATPYDVELPWRELLRVLRLEHDFDLRRETASASTVSGFLVLDHDNPGSIISAVERGRDNIRSVRELVPTELWEAVNALYLDLIARNLRRDIDQEPYVLYHLVKRRCQRIAGVATETMPREDGWRFLRMGWSFERAEMSCRLLDVRYSTPVATPDFDHWESTLKSASALEAYRRAHRSSMDPMDVASFLLLSRTFPRSVLFCLRRAETELGYLSDPGAPLSRPERLLGRVRADLEFTDVREVTAAGLPAFLDRLQHAVRQVAEAVALQYFRNSQEPMISALAFHPAGGPPAAGAEA